MHSDFATFCGLLLLVSSPKLGALAGVIWNHHFARETLHWSRTQGVIEDSDVRIVESDEENSPTKYYADVRYSYSVGTSTLRNDEIWLNSEHQTASYEEAERITERYFVGREVASFFNPENPAQAVLDPGFHTEAYWSLMRKACLYALAPALTLCAVLFLVICRGLAHLVGLP